MKTKIWMWSAVCALVLVAWLMIWSGAEGAVSVGPGGSSGSGASTGTGSGHAIMDTAGVGTNTSFYGSTQYFAPDLPGNTNGPLAFYRLSGVNSVSNLVMEINVGNSGARVTWPVSSTPGGGEYGGWQLQTDHDNPGVPSPNVSEWVLTSVRHIGLLPGTGAAASGHVQIGSYSHLGGYAGAPFSGANVSLYLVDQGPVFNDQYPSNFSGAVAFETSEMQGAAYVNHKPGIFAYSYRTNAPGRWALAFTAELHQTVNGDVWDPNSAKPEKSFQIQSGDITNALFFKSINFVTNLGTASIDCAIPASDQTVNGGTLTFTAPKNFDVLAKQYEHTFQFITNSGAANLTLVAPANARLVGTLSVVRQCQVEWWIKIGQWTNGFVTQVF